jgi:hypothetical protein
MDRVGNKRVQKEASIRRILSFYYQNNNKRGRNLIAAGNK